MAYKRHNFVFAKTAAGSPTWPGGGVAYPGGPSGSSLTSAFRSAASDTETTTVILPDTEGAGTGFGHLYPVTHVSGDVTLSCGQVSGSAPASYDIAYNAATAYNPRLAGAISATSTGIAYQFDAPPNAYKFWLAATTPLFLFAGRYSDLSALSRIATYAPNTAYGNGAAVCSRIDNSVWRVTAVAQAGTSGAASEPSGAGPAFTDGTVTWTRFAKPNGALVNALLHIQPGTANPNGILDQNNNSVTYDAWTASAGRAYTMTPADGGAFTIIRSPAVAMYLEGFAFQAQSTPLQDVTLTSDLSTPYVAAPVFYAAQPAGTIVAKVMAASGPADPASFAISGPLAPYLAVDRVDSGSGLELVIVASATPMPDSVAAATAANRTLTIRQTDPANASATTHDTSFTATVVSSQGKPTVWVPGSTDALITTPNWLNKKTVLDMHAAWLWAGYTGNLFARDTAVASSDALRAELLALMALNGGAGPDKASWYRIRLGTGTYAGTYTDAIHLDFGAGGLLIEPDAGADPAVNCGFTALHVRGFQWRGSKVLLEQASMGGTWLGFIAPSASYAYTNRVKIAGNRLGLMYKAGTAVTDLFTTLPGGASTSNCASAVALNHAESFDFSDNSVRGAMNVATFYNVFAGRRTGNDLQLVAGDCFPTIGLSGENIVKKTAFGLPNNNIYIDERFNKGRNHADFPGLITSSHCDWNQIRRNGLANENYTYANAANYTAGTVFYSPPANAYYTVTTAGTSSLTGTGPTGTGTGIADGAMVCAYLQPGTINVATYLLSEGNDVEENSFYDNSAHGGERQMLLDSNNGKNCPVYASINNNVFANKSSYGISIGDGFLHLERNTLSQPAQMPMGTTASYATITAQAGGGLNVRARGNYIAGGFSMLGRGRIAKTNNVSTSFAKTANPPAYFTGAFTQRSNPGAADDGVWGFAPDTGATTPAQFSANLRTVFASRNAAMGALPLAAATAVTPPPVVTPPATTPPVTPPPVMPAVQPGTYVLTSSVMALATAPAPVVTPPVVTPPATTPPVVTPPPVTPPPVTPPPATTPPATTPPATTPPVVTPPPIVTPVMPLSYATPTSRVIVAAGDYSGNETPQTSIIPPPPFVPAVQPGAYVLTRASITIASSDGASSGTTLAAQPGAYVLTPSLFALAGSSGIAPSVTTSAQPGTYTLNPSAVTLV